MTQKQWTRILFILTFIAVNLTSCNKEEDKRDIQIEKVVVKQEGEFIFQDSMLYLVNDTVEYKIAFETNPADAILYCSKNGNDFFEPAEDWIPVDSTVTFIRFYAEGRGYNPTAIHEIYFGFGNDSIVSTVQVYPNPFTDALHYAFKSEKLRGKYVYSISNIAGEVIQQQKDLVTSDKMENSINVNHLPPGVFILWFDFGNERIGERIVKR